MCPIWNCQLSTLDTVTHECMLTTIQCIQQGRWYGIQKCPFNLKLVLLFSPTINKNKTNGLTSGVVFHATGHLRKRRTGFCCFRLNIVPCLERPQWGAERRWVVQEVAVVIPVSVEAAGTRLVKGRRTLAAGTASVALVRRTVKTTGARAVKRAWSGHHVVATGDSVAAKLEVVVRSQRSRTWRARAAVDCRHCPHARRSNTWKQSLTKYDNYDVLCRTGEDSITPLSNHNNWMISVPNGSNLVRSKIGISAQTTSLPKCSSISMHHFDLPYALLLN